MNDVSRYLPLSQRAPVDETGVSGDWRPLISDSLTLVANLLAALPQDRWNSPSLCAGWTVRETTGHLVWIISSTRREVLSGVIRTCLRKRISPFAAIDTLSRETAQHDPMELIRLLRELAESRLAGIGRRGITDLTEVIVHGYDLAVALALPMSFSPVATGAVAIARASRAPAETRALLRARIFAATDAGWAVGRGTPLAAPAAVLIPRLFGRTLPAPNEVPAPKAVPAELPTDMPTALPAALPAALPTDMPTDLPPAETPE